MLVSPKLQQGEGRSNKESFAGRGGGGKKREMGPGAGAGGEDVPTHLPADTDKWAGPSSQWRSFFKELQPRGGRQWAMEESEGPEPRPGSA